MFVCCAVFVRPAYAVAALFLVVDAASRLFFGRSGSVSSERRRGIHQLDAPETGGRHAEPGRERCSDGERLHHKQKRCLMRMMKL